MREILKGSNMIRRRSSTYIILGSLEQEVFEDKVQEYYSLRCVTQVLGPVYDTIARRKGTGRRIEFGE
jgi:histidine ammonia-lyase